MFCFVANTDMHVFKSAAGGMCEQFTGAIKAALKGATGGDEEEPDVDLGTWDLIHLGNVVVEASELRPRTTHHAPQPHPYTPQ